MWADSLPTGSANPPPAWTEAVTLFTALYARFTDPPQSYANTRSTIARLRATNDSLHATNDSLRATNHSLDATNDRLQAANERLPLPMVDCAPPMKGWKPAMPGWMPPMIDCMLPLPDCTLPMIRCLLPIIDCTLPLPDCKLRNIYRSLWKKHPKTAKATPLFPVKSYDTRIPKNEHSGPGSFKPVRADLLVELAMEMNQAPSGAKSDGRLQGRCRPDGAENQVGLVSTKMPRLRRSGWTHQARADGFPMRVDKSGWLKYNR